MTNCEERAEQIKQIADKIELGQITLLTGSNGSGKSLIRQQIRFRVAKKLGGDCAPLKITADISMAKRASSIPSLGALSGIFMDEPTDPTSLCSYSNVETLLNTFVKNTEFSKRYLVLDEPEIGMTKESQLGLALLIKENVEALLQKTYGVLIISNSEYFISRLANIGVFLNMDGYESVDEWANRTIIPTDFSKLSKESSDLYRYFVENKKKCTNKKGE